jgi:hypothetical protein
MGKYWTELNSGSVSSPGIRVALFLALALVAAALTGCIVVVDNREDPSPTFTADITSDAAADGDIALSPSEIYTVSSALDTGDVLAGVDPVSGDEFRGFLDFPLRGTHGVPSNAVIKSAVLEIFINGISVSSADRILPFLIDLVAFQPPAIIVDDFDRLVQPALLTMPFDFYPSDAGAKVLIDITALMQEAQTEGLPDFQLRFLLDFTATSGLIEIDDRGLETAPLVTVSYS